MILPLKPESFFNSSKFKKIILIIFILAILTISIGIVGYYLHRFIEYHTYKIMHIPIETKKPGKYFSGQYMSNYKTHIINSFNFDMNITNKDLNILSDEEINKLQQTCSLQTELEEDRIYLSQAHLCLAKIYSHKYSVKDNIFKSIKELSIALEIAYLPENVKLLADVLIKGFENNIPEKFSNLSPYITGYKKDEIEILNELIALNIPEITARANYRLKFIYTSGVSSVKDQLEPDLILAMQKLQETIKYSKIVQDNILDIAIIIDNNFVEQTATAIASALLNSDLSSLYRFNIITDPINPVTDESQKKLSNLQGIRNYEIKFIKFSQEFEVVEVIRQKIAECHKKHTRFPPVIAYRLYLDKILPDLKQVLYLDADIIVLNDLNLLKQINLENYFMAAAIDEGSLHYFRTECEGIFKEFYFNSGIILFNLEKMRNEDALDKMKQVVLNTKNCDFEFVDQDILNLAFEDYIFYLSPRWNDIMWHRHDPMIIPNLGSFIKHYAGQKHWMRKSPEEISTLNPAISNEYQLFFRYKKLANYFTYKSP